MKTLIKSFYFSAAFSASLFCCSVNADVTLPRILSDNAILQRDMPLKLWGTASPQESVVVSVDGQHLASTSADKSGRWQIKGKAFTAGGPHTVTVQGRNQITLKDIYFGDVWLASGQSNMEMPLQRMQEKYADAIAASSNPMIRQFKVNKEADYQGPREDFTQGEWQVANPENILNYSTVAYFFARDLNKHLGIPIAIINSSYGGASAQSWMSISALQDYPHYVATAKKLSDPDYLSQLKADKQAPINAWHKSAQEKDKGSLAKPTWFSPDFKPSSPWPEVSIPGDWQEQGIKDFSGVIWLKKVIKLPADAAGKSGMLRLGRIVDADTTYVNGVQVGNTTYLYPQRAYSIPPDLLQVGENTITVRVVTENFNGGVVRDKPYVLEVGDLNIDLKGPWHYKIGMQQSALGAWPFFDFQQPVGIYNAMLAPLLNMTLKGVIWYQGESNVSAAKEYAQLQQDLILDWRKHFGQSNLPFLFVQLPGFGPIQSEPSESELAEMRQSQSKALDLPNTSMAVAIGLGEWNDIHPVNKKEVGQRLALLARSDVYGEKNIAAHSPYAVSVERKKHKLIVVVSNKDKKLHSDGKPGGFAIAGSDGKFVWAKAKIRKNTIELSHPDVKNPTQVRYAWADFPDRANVFGANELPLAPFSMTIKSSADSND